MRQSKEKDMYFNPINFSNCNEVRQEIVKLIKTIDGITKNKSDVHYCECSMAIMKLIEGHSEEVFQWSVAYLYVKHDSGVSPFSQKFKCGVPDMKAQFFRTSD